MVAIKAFHVEVEHCACRSLVQETSRWYQVFVEHVPSEDLLLIDHGDLHTGFELIVRQLDLFLGLCLPENSVMKVRAAR